MRNSINVSLSSTVEYQVGGGGTFKRFTQVTCGEKKSKTLVAVSEREDR